MAITDIGALRRAEKTLNHQIVDTCDPVSFG